MMEVLVFVLMALLVPGSDGFLKTYGTRFMGKYKYTDPNFGE